MDYDENKLVKHKITEMYSAMTYKESEAKYNQKMSYAEELKRQMEEKKTKEQQAKKQREMDEMEHERRIKDEIEHEKEIQNEKKKANNDFKN